MSYYELETYYESYFELETYFRSYYELETYFELYFELKSYLCQSVGIIKAVLSDTVSTARFA